jgi:hypothetical protein
MNYEQINILLRTSLLEIYYHDSLLLDRIVREECINHRLAFYFENLFSNIIHDDMFYTVDVEYNKNLSKSEKEIELDDTTIIPIRPDIIIHKRQDNCNNLIAVEAKLRSLRNHDILKLEKLLRPPYNYKYAVGIKYNPNRPYFAFVGAYTNYKQVASSAFVGAHTNNKQVASYHAFA